MTGNHNNNSIGSVQTEGRNGIRSPILIGCMTVEGGVRRHGSNQRR